MSGNYLFFICVVMIPSVILAQNIDELKKLKLHHNKQNRYQKDLISLYNSKPSGKCTLQGVRHSGIASRKYERVVFDFSQRSLPETYMVNSTKFKRLFIDFSGCETKIEKLKIDQSELIKEVSFYQLEKGNLNIEFGLNGIKETETFFLKNPTRIVIDIKKE